MAWSWGGAATGATKGVSALVDLLQQDEAKKRQDAIDEENRKQRALTNARGALADKLTATEHLGALNDQGGFATDTTQTPVSRTPGLAAMPTIGNVPRGTSENATKATTTRRPLALADLLSPDANIGVDPTQSKAAIQQRAQGAALTRFTQTHSDADKAAALAAGVPPAQLDEIAAKPVAAPPAPKLPGGFEPTDEGRKLSTLYQGGVAHATHVAEPETWHDEPMQVPQPDGTMKTVQGQRSSHGAWKPIPGQGGAGGAGAMSGQTMQTLGRMGTSFNDLSQSIDQMEKMEADPAFRAKLTSLNKAAMAGAETHPNMEAHGLGGFVSNMGGQFLAGKAQEHLDPQLNTYLNLRQRVGTAFTELLPRPNQALLQLEKGMSGIDVGWNDQLMAGVQARRRGGLDVLKNILAQQGMLDENGRVSGKKNTPGAGGRSGNPPAPTVTAPANPATWIKANPQQADESDAAYKARYHKATGQQ